MAVVKLILLITMATASPQFASALNERAIEPAPSHLFLFAASISNPTFGHTCTGIILNKRWIISSALCIAEHSQDENELKIYYGSHNRTHNQRKTADIEKIVFHPAFEQRKLRNNLALMRIKADIDFIPTVVEAAVLPTKDAFPNDTAAVIGWEQIDAEVGERNSTFLSLSLLFYWLSLNRIDFKRIRALVFFYRCWDFEFSFVFICIRSVSISASIRYARNAQIPTHRNYIIGFVFAIDFPPNEWNHWPKFMHARNSWRYISRSG